MRPRRITTSALAGRVLAFALVWIASLTPVAGQPVPTVMNYQGRLTDNTPSQNPIDVALPMTFRIFGSASGVDLLWIESWASISVRNGIFSVLLGSNGTPLPPSVFSGATNRFLEVQIGAEVLAPRQQLGTVGYAAKADTAAEVTCTGCVASTEVLDSSLTAIDLAPDSVSASEIAADAVGSSEIAAGAVGASEIAIDAVGASEIAPNAVRASEIATGSVGPSEVDSTASFVMGGLDITGNLVVDGNVSLIGIVEENGCADGTVEQRFPGLSSSSANRKMVGCSGVETFDNRADLCAPGWRVCSRIEWQNNFGAMDPMSNYWVNDRLFFNGSTSNDCAVSTASGGNCGATTSMKVCSPTGGCTWRNCGYGTVVTGLHYYYGGCQPPTAGALCCKGEPTANVFQFADTSGNNISDTWLDTNWTNLLVESSWYLFVEVQMNAGEPVQYCLSDAKWYVDNYLAITPGGSSISDGGMTKYYRLSTGGAWLVTNEARTNFWGTTCSSGGLYSWCIAWGMGGATLGIVPTEINFGEVRSATATPSTMRLRVAPTRLSACGF